MTCSACGRSGLNHKARKRRADKNRKRDEKLYKEAKERIEEIEAAIEQFAEEELKTERIRMPSKPRERKSGKKKR